MFRRVARIAFFVALLLAVWTVSGSAFAMPAGLCDDRGATAIAPPPALQAPDDALRQARVPAVCAGAELPLRATVGPQHGGAVSSSFDGDHALAIVPPVLAPPSGERVAPGAGRCELSPGIRLRIERPPRH